MPFKKGDPRINRKGRPKSFDEARRLAVAIANEVATDAAGNAIIIDGHKSTNAEMILRSWMKSKQPRLQEMFMAYAFGKPPDKHEVTGEEGAPLEHKIEVIGIDYRSAITNLAPRPVGDSDPSCED